MSDRQDERIHRGTIADRTEWHIDKSISVGHMVSTLALAGALMGFVFSTNTKVEMVGVRLDAVEQRVTREVARQAEDMAAIRTSLQRLEDKLDRAVERDQ